MEPFDKVVAEHGPVVLRVCRALLDPNDADDAWSDTFLAAMRSYPDLRAHPDADRNVRGWLVTIAHRKSIDLLRARARAPQPTDCLPERVRIDGPEHLDDDLRRALLALAPKQRGAVVLHHIAGIPYAEVGLILGTSEAAARRSAADGIARLRTTYVKDAP